MSLPAAIRDTTASIDMWYASARRDIVPAEQHMYVGIIYRVGNYGRLRLGRGRSDYSAMPWVQPGTADVVS